MKRVPDTVVQIVGSLGIGGAERIGMELAKYVAAQGHRSFVVAATDHRTIQEYVDDLARHGVTVEILSGSLWGKARSAFRRSSTLRPRVVHVHTELPEVLGMAWKLGWPPLRLVRTIHNSVVWPRHPVARVGMGMAYALSRAYSVSCLAPPPVPVHETVLNGIRWHMADVTGKDRHVAFVGRLEPQKSPEDVLEIGRLVHAKVPDFALHIIGDGGLRERLMQRYSEPWIIWHGALARPASVLQRTRVVLLASQFEGFPLVALEALDNVNYVVAPDDLPTITALPWSITYRRGHFNEAAHRIGDILTGAFDESRLLAWRRDAANAYGLQRMLNHYLHIYYNALT